MISFNMTDFISEKTLKLSTIPFIILFLPVGVVYSFICFVNSVRDGLPFKSYKHDILYSILRPGFYIGAFFVLFVTIIMNAFTSKFKKYFNISDKSGV